MVKHHRSVVHRGPFESMLFRYPGKGGWTFAPIPKKLAPPVTRPWGRTPVHAVVDGVSWDTRVKTLGWSSDLDAAIKTRYAAEPANVPTWLPPMYWRAMLNGTGKLGPLTNDRYPDIRPTGVREYVARLATERAPGGAHG
jgi:hypothetical protein